jgi:hypothetical protein
MFAALRGEPTNRIPWAPRLDLWYNARSRTNSLPHRYRNATLNEIIDDLGWGSHNVIPRFKDLRGPEDDMHRGLGIYNLRTMPYQTRLHNVRVASSTQGDYTVTSYETPLGTVTTRILYDEGMRSSGISITHIADHVIRDVRDYPVIAHIFENAEVEPNPSGFEEFCSSVGDRGIAVGYIALAASPMHLLQRELMTMEQFFYEMHDHSGELAACAGSIASYYHRVFDAVSQSHAQVFLLGANYDNGVTPPPFFRDHILPWLRQCADTLHRQGKFLMTHTDGENTGLLDLYLASGIDVADSVCPSPMTRLSLRETRRHFAGRITIMGGFPSIALLPHTVPDSEYEEFVDRFFQDLDGGDHLILGISDSTPPQAELERLQSIKKAIDRFGPVTSGSRPRSGPAR